jgi:hypothetical protein
MTAARTKNAKAKAARKKRATRKDRPCVAAYVEWNYVPRIGRGVIARFDALKGTVLERSPVVVAPTGDFEAKHGKKTVIDNYLLTWEEKGPDIEYAVGLGYLMLYNHSSRPNAEFCYNYPDREIEMVALRNIAAGEEITHNYGGVWFKPRPEKKKKKAVAKKKPAAKPKARKAKVKK